ncbi:MAG TPA: type 4a pilus biogenesis protein PilO [Candidatus Acidoferrales bacterium]|jgi:Tfp pilus assembly protein PilO|nr:type 4a pilus biogenesis protein PilO [Candidatus Acidoferrales bacterium]
MNRNSRQWKRWVRIALAVVLAADALLVYANWSATDPAARAAAARLEKLHEEHGLLKADVERVSAIRDHLSEVQRDADHFYSQEFLPAGMGYSSIISDLGKISKSSGLGTSNVQFKERPLETRGVTEITVTATVEGQYVSLVRFINGLERSSNFYLLDNLTLASSTGGNIKLNLQLRTYFRM